LHPRFQVLQNPDGTWNLFDINAEPAADEALRQAEATPTGAPVFVQDYATELEVYNQAFGDPMLMDESDTLLPNLQIQQNPDGTYNLFDINAAPETNILDDIIDEFDFKPSGKPNWTQYTMEGERSNDREFYITLPRNKGEANEMVRDWKRRTPDRTRGSRQ